MNRHITLRTTLLSVAMFGVASTVISLAAPRPASVAVRVTLADDPTHKIASDRLGPYQNGSGVSATIDANDHLLIYAQSSKTVPARRFALTFDDCIIIGTCNQAVPFSSQLITITQIIAGVRQPDGTPHPGGLLTMPVGAPGFRAGLKVYVGSISSALWTLCLTPGDATGFCANSTGSTPARIVRTKNESWTIWTADPGDPALRSDVGELFTETGNARQKLITLQGKYAMPFSMTIECVNAASCQAPAP